MRYCTASGYLDLKSKGSKPNDIDSDYGQLGPWFSHPNQLPADTRVLFGHWAALGCETNDPQIIALDSGCVWGGELTFFNPDSGERLGEPRGD